MIKIIVILFVLLPAVCSAGVSGSMYFGKYFESKYLDLERRPVLYHAGVYLEIDFGDSLPVLFLEDKTLMAGRGVVGFNPIQINYKVGVKKAIKNVQLIYQHECLHPVDGVTNGLAAQSYNLIEIRYDF